MNKLFPLCLILAFMLTGCATSKDKILESDASQVALRSIQTRAFDTTDKEKMLRTIIVTLQDLGFVIDKADNQLGTISATKLKGYELRITVFVRARGDTQLLVRASAQYQLQAVDEPKPYQDFFAALGKAIFLEAHSIQ